MVSRHASPFLRGSVSFLSTFASVINRDHDRSQSGLYTSLLVFRQNSMQQRTSRVHGLLLKKKGRAGQTRPTLGGGPCRKRRGSKRPMLCNIYSPQIMLVIFSYPHGRTRCTDYAQFLFKPVLDPCCRFSTAVGDFPRIINMQGYQTRLNSSGCPLPISFQIT